MLEKTVKAAVRKRLHELGAYQFWAVQMGLGAPTLDVLICVNGKFGAIECKRPGDKPTVRQKLTIEEIKKAGGTVLIIDNPKDAAKINF